MNFRQIISLFVVFALGACATGPTTTSTQPTSAPAQQTAAESTGQSQALPAEKFRFGERFMGAQKWLISQVAPRGTTKQAAQEHLVFRAADVALVRGFDRMVILGFDMNYSPGAGATGPQRTEQTIVTSGGELQTQSRTVYPDTVGNVSSSTAVMVRYLKPGEAPAEGEKPVDAKKVREQLIAKYPYLAGTQWISLQ